MANDQVSLPYLVILLVVIGFATRYLFFSGPAQPARPRQDNGVRMANMARRREEMVQRIQQMFPQVDRRTLLWDLQRNGGSIQMTSERILAGRLEAVS
jgi:coupling of ubiquitin conjugation to ER degradation protein 1